MNLFVEELELQIFFFEMKDDFGCFNCAIFVFSTSLQRLYLYLS